jgi:TonB family protein
VTTTHRILDAQRPPWLLWTAAAITAVSLHAGGAALALVHLQTDEDTQSLGSSGSAIDIELAAPNVERTDLPVGPDTDASVASPALAEQKAEIKPTDLPKDKPDETDNADRVVTQNDSKKPTDDNPKVETVQTAASQESVAQEATAQQPIEGAKEAKVATVTDTDGLANQRGKLMADWGRQISAIFERHKRYPKVSKLREAKVKVSLVLDRLGKVVQLGILESSGDSLFDEEALSMIRRSEKEIPRPKFELTQDTVSYSLDVNFKGGK